MIILIVGPPGSGKTTLAEMLAEKENFTRVSVGDLIRDNIAKFNEGQEDRLNNGKLVDFETVNQLVEQRIEATSFDENIVIDGYPRELETAQWLVSRYRDRIQCNIQLTVSKKELYRRLKIRGRNDDKVKTVLTRFEIFNNNQPAIVSCLKDNGIQTFRINTSRVKGEAYQSIKEVISKTSVRLV